MATFTVEVRRNSSFFPASVMIAPGDTVIWVRMGGFHNVVADDGRFRLGEGSSDNPSSWWTRVSHTFNMVSIFRYFCELHGGPNRNTHSVANRYRYDRVARCEQNLHASGHQIIAGALGMVTHGRRAPLHSARTPSFRISVINSINKAW